MVFKYCDTLSAYISVMDCDIGIKQKVTLTIRFFPFSEWILITNFFSRNFSNRNLNFYFVILNEYNDLLSQDM